MSHISNSAGLTRFAVRNQLYIFLFAWIKQWQNHQHKSSVASGWHPDRWVFVTLQHKCMAQHLRKLSTRTFVHLQLLTRLHTWKLEGLYNCTPARLYICNCWNSCTLENLDTPRAECLRARSFRPPENISSVWAPYMQGLGTFFSSSSWWQQQNITSSSNALLRTSQVFGPQIC